MDKLFKTVLLLTMLFGVTEPTLSLGPPADTRQTTIITVGAINYGDYQRTYVDVQQKLTALAEAYNADTSHKDIRVSFQLAVGSYDDVLDWYKKGYVNLAILSPGPVAALLDAQEWGDRLIKLYIGTAIATAAKPENSLAVYERRHSEILKYHSVCLVGAGSPIQTQEALKEAIAADRVTFLFVDPLSASGRILPEYALHRIPGVDRQHLKKALKDAQWTYSHEASLKWLAQPAADNKINVAFVQDQMGDDPDVRSKFHKIDFKELDQPWIPQEVVLLSAKAQEKEQLVKDFFFPAKESARKYVNDPNWFKEYKDGIVAWMRDLENKPEFTGKPHFGVQEIISKVRFYESNHPGEARTRLALVLSGGGAKCAYQAGVIQAIEDEIAESNEIARQNAAVLAASGTWDKPEPGTSPKPSPRPIDIDLVVGTSGGAINALAVAAGLTTKRDGQQALQHTWMDFKQRDFFQPWSPMPVMVGLIVGAAQALILIVGLRLVDDEKIRWGSRTRPALIVFGSLAIVLALSSWRFWSSLPLIAMLVMIGVQLYDNQAKDWRGLTGGCLVALGLIELVFGIVDVSFLNSARFVIPVLIFLVLASILVLGTRVLTLDGAGSRKFVRITFPIMLVVAGVITWRWQGDMLRAVKREHLFVHLWMTLSLNLAVTALFLLVIGGLMLAAEWSIRRQAKAEMDSDHKDSPEVKREAQVTVGPVKQRFGSLTDDNATFFGRRKPIVNALTIALILLLGLQLGRTFLWDPSLSMSEGVDRAFVEKLPRLLQHHPRLNSTIKPQGQDDQQRLADISTQILNRQLLSRDLIITNSLLDINAEQPDRYFYYQAPTASIPLPPAQDNDVRFRSFQEPGLAPSLLDVIIGSATIYPVFRPRKVIVSDKGESLEIIDGGFAHNSPIEAAVAWGAKFIILIEASPNPTPSKRRNLLDNSFDAFNYLFKEAQLTDARSRGKIEIFQIQPDPDNPDSEPNLCTFDFDGDLIQGAIDKGLNDAINPNQLKFGRTRGQPIF